MYPRYVKVTANKSASAPIVHATVPLENGQVECEALCGETFYPPIDGEPEAEFLHESTIDCPRCLIVVKALTVHTPDSVRKAVESHYQRPRDKDIQALVGLGMSNSDAFINRILRSIEDASLSLPEASKACGVAINAMAISEACDAGGGLVSIKKQALIDLTDGLSANINLKTANFIIDSL